ncbi:MAG: GFA family protein [Pseudomonadales bacterium]|nr:GFA family protein [Pseudomonadales bacterium]
MSQTGGCLCGAVRYELAEAPTMMGVCHCKNCQKQAGSAFSTLAAVPIAGFTLTGTPKQYVDRDTDSGNYVERWFCGDCGSPIYSALPSMTDQIFLKTGTLDDTSGFAPQFNVWCSAKQNWVDLPEGVPALEKT